MVDYKDRFIGFADELAPSVKDESKVWTFRIGNKYDYLEVGDTIGARNSTTGDIFARLEITDKYKTIFSELPIDMDGHEKYSSKDHQRKVFESFSSRNVNDDDVVLVLGFKLVKE